MVLPGPQPVTTAGQSAYAVASRNTPQQRATAFRAHGSSGKSPLAHSAMTPVRPGQKAPSDITTNPVTAPNGVGKSVPPAVSQEQLRQVMDSTASSPGDAICTVSVDEHSRGPEQHTG
jgi:hypothetical protein